MATLKAFQDKQFERIQCRVTLHEKKVLQAKADLAGKSLGRYIVELGLSADSDRKDSAQEPIVSAVVNTEPTEPTELYSVIEVCSEPTELYSLQLNTIEVTLSKGDTYREIADWYDDESRCGSEEYAKGRMPIDEYLVKYSGYTREDAHDCAVYWNRVAQRLKDSKAHQLIREQEQKEYIDRWRVVMAEQAQKAAQKRTRKPKVIPTI